MLVLKFNYDQMALDLCDKLVDAVDEIMERFMRDATKDLKSKDYEQKKAIFYMASKKIIGQCVFYAHSILESFGRGSLMAEDNDALTEYMDSQYWNPERHSKTIVGRREGYYTNIFGEKVKSSGNFEGLYMEHRVTPIEPKKYTIQNAENDLYRILNGGGYGFRTLEKYANEFFENMDSSKYFYNVEV